MDYTAQRFPSHSFAQKKKKFIVLNSILIAAILILAIAQVLILNRDSTNGEKLTSMNIEMNNLRAEIVDLDQKVASASALSLIFSKAETSGFTNHEKLVTISNQNPLAFNPQ